MTITWIILTFVIVLLASFGASIPILVIFLKNRSNNKERIKYAISLLSENTLKKQLEKQREILGNIKKVIDTSDKNDISEQSSLMDQLASSRAEIEQMKHNVVSAMDATDKIRDKKNNRGSSKTRKESA